MAARVHFILVLCLKPWCFYLPLLENLRKWRIFNGLLWGLSKKRKITEIPCTKFRPKGEQFLWPDGSIFCLIMLGNFLITADTIVKFHSLPGSLNIKQIINEFLKGGLFPQSPFLDLCKEKEMRFFLRFFFFFSSVLTAQFWDSNYHLV